MKQETQRFRFLLCDLDNTLYPPDAGVMPAVGRRMLHFIIDHVGASPEEAERLKSRYYQEYGTTMRGLMLHHGIDPDEYLAFVHDVPLEEYIQPNPDLDGVLASIPLRKAVFTNADEDHARRVLDVLGVRRHFERIIDVRQVGFNSKPHQHAYGCILDILDARAGQCILVEDSVENLGPAKAMGMLTVLVGVDSIPAHVRQDGADIRIPNILHLADAIRPWLGKP